MHGFDTISLRSEDQAKSRDGRPDWPGAKLFAVHDGAGGWIHTVASAAGPFRFRHKDISRGPTYMTMEVELPRLVRGESNVMVPWAAQRQALDLVQDVWLSAGGNENPVVWRLDAACDVPWPASCWPALKEMAAKLRAPRYEGTSRAATESWDQRNRRIKMYPKEGNYARLEYHLGKSKAIAEALPDRALEGLTLLDLKALGNEISRLMLLRAADQVGLWSVRSGESKTDLLGQLMANPDLSGGGVLRLFGAACAIEAVGEEALLASTPTPKRRTLYRVLQELRDLGLKPGGGPLEEYTEQLYRALMPLDKGQVGERIMLDAGARGLKQALETERERRKAA